MTRRICVFVAVASFALMTQILSLLPQNKKNLALAFAFMPSLYTRHSACVCECASVNTSTHLHALHLCGHKMACVYGGVYISVCVCVCQCQCQCLESDFFSAHHGQDDLHACMLVGALSMGLYNLLIWRLVGVFQAWRLLCHTATSR